MEVKTQHSLKAPSGERGIHFSIALKTDANYVEIKIGLTFMRDVNVEINVEIPFKSLASSFKHRPNDF